MPATIARREHAKSVIDRSIRKALNDTSGKPRKQFVQLLCIVRGRSDLLRPARFRGRINAGWLDTILGGLRTLNEYRKSWVRPAEDWSPEGSNPLPLFASLAHHLLATYPVPPVLLSAWFQGNDWAGHQQRRWFLLAGQGKSLRSIGFPIRLTRRMAHVFAQAPAQFPVGFALRWAQVRSFGGSNEVARAVASTRLGREFSGGEFWESVVQFIVNHPKLELEEIDSVVEYLNDQKFEQRLVIVGEDTEVYVDAPQPDLCLRGWSVASLLRRVAEWKARERPAGPERKLIRWDRSGIGGFRWQDLDGRSWTILELLDSDALAAEGKAMEHCAATYTDVCARRLTTIWSMGIEGPESRDRVLTLEVNPASREVVQAKAKNNADPDDQGQAVLAAWAQREGLKIEL